MKAGNWSIRGGTMYATTVEVEPHKCVQQVLVRLHRPDGKLLLVCLKPDEAAAIGKELSAASKRLGKSR